MKNKMIQILVTDPISDAGISVLENAKIKVVVDTNANKKDLLKTTNHIKKVLGKIFKKDSPAVLYGGSVDENNIDMFKQIREIDGFLIGGASKSSKKFIDIIKNYYR